MRSLFFPLVVFLISIPFIGVLGNNSPEELRKKIVVIDGVISQDQLSEPYMCKNGSVSMNSTFTSSRDLSTATKSEEFHGKNIVGLVGELIDSKKYCIYHIAAYFVEDKNSFGRDSLKGLNLTLGLTNVVAVNLSEACDNLPGTFSLNEYLAVEKITQKGIKIITAAGNSGQYLTSSNCNVYPACNQLRLNRIEKDNYIVVASTTYYLDNLGNPKIFSNFSHDLILNFEDGVSKGYPAMTGTSQATAVFTGKMFSK